MHILFCSCPCKVGSRVSDALSQALCNLSLSFLANFTLPDSICFTVKLFSLANYTLLFIWIERQDHSVHMSSVLQVQQLYTVGIPLWEYLCWRHTLTGNDRSQGQEQNGRSLRGPDSYACAFFAE